MLLRVCAAGAGDVGVIRLVHTPPAPAARTRTRTRSMHLHPQHAPAPAAHM